MTKTGFVVLRDGEVKTRCFGSVRADGTVWLPTKKGVGPLVNSTAQGFDRDAIMALVEAGKFDEIPSSMIAKIGENEGGLVVRYADEYDRELRADIEASLTPADHERIRISGLYAKAERLEHASYYDPSAICRARSEAEMAHAKWREDYPDAAREESADNLDARAEHEEDLARGAMVYDADGWLDNAAQQARHDEFMAKAAALRRQAAELRA
jgi:hypothetical protein